MALALLLAAPGLAMADTPPAAPAEAAAPPALPPLESRDIATRPPPKSPQDMLLPGERLHSRWADPNHPDAPGRTTPAAPRAASPTRSAAILPPPVRVTPIPPAPAPVAAAPAPAKPPAEKPSRRGTTKATPPLRLDLSPCNGQYFLDGVAVDSMGRPCAGF